MSTAHDWYQFKESPAHIIEKYGQIIPVCQRTVFLLNVLKREQLDKIWVNPVLELIAIESQMGPQDRRLNLYGNHQLTGDEPFKLDEFQIINSSHQIQETDLRTSYMIYDLQQDYHERMNSRIKRQQKLFQTINIDVNYFVPGSQDWKAFIYVFEKFTFLKNLKIGSYLNFYKRFNREDDWLNEYIKLGSMTVDGKFKIYFAQSTIKEATGLDFHFSLQRDVPKKINLTSFLHFRMLELASLQGLRYYNFGIVDNPLTKNYEGIREYKQQWGGDLSYTWLSTSPRQQD
jgi:hypothetical protein